MKKIKNAKLESVLMFFNKLVVLDFEDFDVALDIANESSTIEKALTGFYKLRDALKEKANKVKQDDPEFGKIQDKLNADWVKLLDTESNVDLKFKVTKTFLKEHSVKLKPLEIKLIMDLGIYEDNTVKEVEVEEVN
jgi:hypothetical protein